MPRLYEAVCAECGHKSGSLRDGYALRSSDDPFTYRWLYHPGESREVERAGYTWAQAIRQNRLIEIEALTCGNCGLPNLKPVAVNEESCLIWFTALIGFLGIAPLCLPPGLPYWTRFLAAGGMHFLAYKGYAHICALRGRKRQAQLPALPGCQECGSTDLSPLSAGKTGNCPQCRAQAFRYEMTGTT